MTKGRLEAFSDGVIAVIITIMVLDMKPPQGSSPSALLAVAPVFLAYVLSFMNVGIYWTNHHHLLHAIQHVNGLSLWANLHLLFWLSLFPFMTAWVGQTHAAPWPVAIYGAVLFLAGCAYLVLTKTLIRVHGLESVLARSLGRDRKGKLSVIIYAVSAPLAFVHSWLALTGYCLVAAMWFIPDRRIEQRLT